MTASHSELGEALLRDPLANVNNAALLLAAIRPDGDPVRTRDSAAGRGCRLRSALVGVAPAALWCPISQRLCPGGHRRTCLQPSLRCWSSSWTPASAGS